MSTVPAPRPPRAHRRTAAVALAAVTALLLAGCGLRWETDATAEPAPDAAETLRRDAVDDALDLAAAARGAGTGSDAAVAPVLDAVAATADVQVDALGGVYASGLPVPEDSPTPTPAPTSVTATPAEVLTLLGEAASQARDGARRAEDAGMARLLASVAASRAQLATRLAGALGTEVPALDVDPADGWTRGGDADGSGSGDGSAATPDPTPSDSPTATSATTPAAEVQDDEAGSDLGRATLVDLVLAEDQAGYALEVAAARLADADRDRARTAAAQHRATATAWATAAGVAGTAEDPRRVAYALDADLSSAEAVRAAVAALLADLAAVHGDALLATTAGTTDRTALVDGLRTAAVDALAWGAEPTALPGVPEVSAAPEPTPTPEG